MKRERERDRKWKLKSSLKRTHARVSALSITCDGQLNPRDTFSEYSTYIHIMGSSPPVDSHCFAKHRNGFLIKEKNEVTIAYSNVPYLTSR